MEYIKMEQRAEEQRMQLRQAVTELRLQVEALHAATPAQPNWFAKKMITLGAWMIATGESLRRHYQISPTPLPKT